jgi:hypothetical protein
LITISDGKVVASSQNGAGIGTSYAEGKDTVIWIGAVLISGGSIGAGYGFHDRCGEQVRGWDWLWPGS